MMILGVIELPENLYWKNEFDYKETAQTVERTVAGGVVVESAGLAFGQKILLTGAWCNRTKVKEIKAAESLGLAVNFKTNSDENHAVVFDIESGGVQAELVSPESNPADETLYELTINLLTVEAV